VQPGLLVLFITGYASSALDGQIASGMEAIGKPFALDRGKATLAAVEAQFHTSLKSL